MAKFITDDTKDSLAKDFYDFCNGIISQVEGLRGIFNDDVYSNIIHESINVVKKEYELYDKLNKLDPEVIRKEIERYGD